MDLAVPTYFLMAIGIYNLLGSLLLYNFLNPKIANSVLQTWAAIITQPHDIGKYGSLWLCWAATTNVFFSLINIAAINWEKSAQLTIIWGDIFVYAVFLGLIIVGLNHPDYGKGNLFSLIFAIGWIIWAVYTLTVL